MKEISFDGFGDDYGSNFGRRKFYVPPACAKCEFECDVGFLCGSGDNGDDNRGNSSNFMSDDDDLAAKQTCFETPIPDW